MPDQASLRPAPRERELLEHIERLAKRHAGRIAVHVHLSRLSRANSREHHIRLATDMFSGAVSTVEGNLFALHNNDLVFVAAEAPYPALNRAIDRLRALFAEDPMFRQKDTENGTFCTWYRLENDYDKLLKDAGDWLYAAQQAQSAETQKGAMQTLAPMQTDLLGRVERTLENTDITNIARRQLICSILPGQAPQALFEELYVSIHDLQTQITPGVSWLSNPWLFQYLSHALDRRMMAMLMQRGVPDMPFSINLNVASVLSPEFRRFDETVSPQLRGRLVIELNKIDVFADMGAFLFARDYLHERGFRVCLDGMTHLTLPYYNRARLGFDLVKIFWSPDGIEDMQPEMIAPVRNIVMEAGQARTILARCENQRAYEIGQQLGIVMFQGRYVDRLYAAKNGKK